MIVYKIHETTRDEKQKDMQYLKYFISEVNKKSFYLPAELTVQVSNTRRFQICNNLHFSVGELNDHLYL